MSKISAAWRECDLEPGSEKPARTRTVTIDGKTRLIDLCGDCYTEVVGPLVDILQENGSPVPRKGTKSKNSQGVTYVLELSEDNRIICPACPDTFATIDEAVPHLHRHGL